MADYLQGFDVSHQNGMIDWTRITAGANPPQFVYLKATEGSNMVDRQFNVNRAGASALGLPCGAYHFFVPDIPVADQVSHFCQTIGSVHGDLPPMLDVECQGPAPAMYAGAVAQWLQLVADRLGCTPGIYTSANFWNNALGSFAPFQQYPLWIAHYTSAPAPRLPAGAMPYTFWQYSDTGVVSGIAGPVDQSRFAGTSDQLRRLVCGA